jgi:hypothetical protein
MEKARRREHRRRAVTGAVALVVGVAGAAVAFRAFFGPAPEPARPSGGNYEIEARLATPNDPLGHHAGPDFQWIHVDVRWDPDRYPGVHECTWSALDDSGDVVARRRDLYAPMTAIARGREEWFRKLFPLRGDPVSAAASCNKRRLDVPGISDVDPLPRGVRWDNLDKMIDARLDAWARRFRIHRMSTDELAGNLWAIRIAGARMWRQDQGDAFLEGARELSARLGALCQRLPLGHVFRNGEFCDSGARFRDRGPRISPPNDRYLIGRGGEAGGWELFVLREDGEVALGFALGNGEWGYATSPTGDPCRIESDRIHWLHLRGSRDRIVVLQFSALSPEADSVVFELQDGRTLPGEILRIPDRIAPWDAFAVVFEGTRDVAVSEIVVRDAAGVRLNDPANC